MRRFLFLTLWSVAAIGHLRPATASCPTNRVVECGAAWDFDAPGLSDVCGSTNATVIVLDTVTNASCGNTFTATRTWQITDGCSNSITCSQTITVVDTTPPVLSCVSNRIVECGAAWDFIPPTVSDVCDGTNVSLVVLSTTTNQLIGETFAATRTWQATDACSNSAACSQTVTILDTTPPQITCPSNILVECDGPPGKQVFFSPVASDGCDTNVAVVCVPPSSSSFALGTNLVTCTATDDSGNTNQCTFEVVVVDTTPPQITCPANIIASEAPRDSGGAAVSFPAPLATDICDNAVQLVSSAPSPSVFPLGTNTVTWTAIDASGNSNSCTFTIRVIPYRLFVVTNTDDAGPGSLRQALLDGNDAPDENLILFNLPGAGPHVIHLLSALPVVTSPTIIDGWSASGLNEPPAVELDGGGGTNAFDGLVIRADGSTIRGLALYGFATAIRLEAHSYSVIQGNYIGTDSTGTNAPGNAGDGIHVNSSHHWIGGELPGTGNVIAGNGGNGIHFDSSNAMFNVIRGNLIGVARDGVSPLGNGGDGLLFGDQTARNLVGGCATDGNVIAHNGANGIRLSATAGVQNPILANSIHSNARLGIDLGGDGPTPNDLEDPDGGPNLNQNFPVLIDAQSLGGITAIQGTLNSMPVGNYRIEFFLNDTPDASGFGEGQTFLGARVVFVHGDGNGDFFEPFTVAATADHFVTATATDAEGNTSEFSPAVRVRTPPVLESQPTSITTDIGSNVTLCVTASGTPPFYYQWRHNGANIAGATDSCYTIPAVELTDAGAYSVVIRNDVGTAGTIPVGLRLSLPGLAAGDNFVDRVPLTGTPGLVVGANRGATRESGEPNHAGKPGGKSVWYTWEAPITGIATFGTPGSTFDTLLGVYRGTNVAFLTRDGSDEDRGGFFTSGVQFNAFKKRVYHFAIDGFAGQEGDFAFGWQMIDTPHMLPVITIQPQSRTVTSNAPVTFVVAANRICGGGHNACPLPSHYPQEQLPGIFVQWFFEGRPIPGETNYSLTIPNVQPVHVGQYTARVSARYFTDNIERIVESNIADLQISISDGDPQTAQAMDKLEDALQAAAIVVGTPGGGGEVAARGAEGAGVIVSGYSGTQIFNTTNSSGQGELFCGFIGGASEWLTFQPAQSGIFRLDTDGSSFDTLLAVLLSNVPPTLLACDNNSGRGGTNSKVEVVVQAGSTYLVGVDGVNGAWGTVVLNYNLDTNVSLTVPTVTTLGVTNNIYSLRVTGVGTNKFVIQVSSNLFSWTPLTTNSTLTSLFDYVDYRSTNFARRYYRAQILP